MSPGDQTWASFDNTSQTLVPLASNLAAAAPSATTPQPARGIILNEHGPSSPRNRRTVLVVWWGGPLYFTVFLV